MGPLPQVDTMVFKTLQTYSDGNVSRWIEEPHAGRRGAGEPGAGADPGGGGRASPSAAPAPAAPAATDDDDDDDSGSTAIVLGVAGLLAGLGGLALGGLAFARTRREPTPKS